MFHPPLAPCFRRGPFLLPMPIPETAFVWPFPDYPAFSRVALLSSRGVSGSDFLARIALTGVSVFCSSLFLSPFKFHFNSVPALLTSLLVEPPPVSFWAWPQVRKCADSFQQCLFRLVPCGLRRREAVTAMERHIKTPEPDLRPFPAYSPGRYAARRSTTSSLGKDQAYRIVRTKVQE